MIKYYIGKYIILKDKSNIYWIEDTTSSIPILRRLDKNTKVKDLI